MSSLTENYDPEWHIFYETCIGQLWWYDLVMSKLSSQYAPKLCFSSNTSVTNIAATMRESNIVHSCTEILRCWQVLFGSFEHLLVHYLVEVIELNLLVNAGPIYVCSTLFRANVVTMHHAWSGSLNTKERGNWFPIFPWVYQIIIITQFVTYLEINCYLKYDIIIILIIYLFGIAPHP